MSSYQYITHCGDKTVIRSSYLHNEIFYTGNMNLYIESEPMAICSIMLPCCDGGVGHPSGHSSSVGTGTRRPEASTRAASAAASAETSTTPSTTATPKTTTSTTFTVALVNWKKKTGWCLLHDDNRIWKYFSFTSHLCRNSIGHWRLTYKGPVMRCFDFTHPYHHHIYHHYGPHTETEKNEVEICNGNRKRHTKTKSPLSQMINRLRSVLI